MMFDLSFTLKEILKSYQRPLKHVLVVEDDVFLKPLLAKVIYSIDPKMTLKWVTSAEEARAALKEKRYSITISDYLLAGEETGLSLWDLCCQRYPKMPFLMISGLSQKSIDRLSERKSSSPTLLCKPFFVSECKAVVLDLLSDIDSQSRA